jgi:hypothetical protein
VFCLEPITEYGYCCASRDDPKCSNGRLCTYQAPVDSVGLHLWPCVHEPLVCGQQEEYLATSEVQVIEPMAGSNLYYNRGATCRYKVTFPNDGNDYDELTLSINKLENATLYAVDTLRFDS